MIEKLGESVEGRAIEAYVRNGPGKRVTLVLGGMHGDEPKSVYVARELAMLLHSDPTSGGHSHWVIVPLVNPDGFERRKRRNAHGVDVNRNFPTRNWTRTSARSRMFSGFEPGVEPETRAVMAAVVRFAPARIIALHSISGNRFCNNFDGPAKAMAAVMAQLNGYPIQASIGYPTPGSFGTWAGVERGIPTVTLELPSHHSPKRCWAENRQAILTVR